MLLGTTADVDEQNFYSEQKVLRMVVLKNLSLIIGVLSLFSYAAIKAKSYSILRNSPVDLGISELEMLNSFANFGLAVLMLSAFISIYAQTEIMRKADSEGKSK